MARLRIEAPVKRESRHGPVGGNETRTDSRTGEAKARGDPDFPVASHRHRMAARSLPADPQGWGPGRGWADGRGLCSEPGGDLRLLLDRAKSGDRYRAPPMRRAHIPKEDGSNRTRPIGVPTFEEKLFQRAVAMVLNAVYEQDFLDCSYGFRPGRSAHGALNALWQQVMPTHGGWAWCSSGDSPASGWPNSARSQRLSSFSVSSTSAGRTGTARSRLFASRARSPRPELLHPEV